MIYKKGDATRPTETPAVIAHICNDEGGWGAGFVLAVSNRWTQPETAYRRISDYKLGTIQLIQVEKGLWVCNMIAQHGYQSSSNPQPVRYDHLGVCLAKLNVWAEARNTEVVMPKIGSALGGGKWEEISEIIENNLTVNTTVYEFG